MTRRELLALLAALPYAVRLEAQTRPTGKHRIFLGQGHGLLLAPDGTLQSWSLNHSAMRPYEAQDALGLGHNQLGNPYVLRPVPGVSNVVAAAAGSNLSFAVLRDGRILAWGSGASGKLGITPQAEFEKMAQERGRTNTPMPLAVRFDAVDVACTGDHVMALTREGTVYTWGLGASGQLGIGPLPTVTFKTRSARVMPYVPYPVPVSNLTGVKAVSAGHLHSLALLEDGTVRAWGANDRGQVGDGTTTGRERPIAVPVVRNAVAISAGDYFSVALLADGTVVEWGSTYAGMYGGKDRLVPVPVKGASGIRAIAAGNGFVAAITQTGGVMTWGQASHYETGQGRQGGIVPALLKGISGAQSVAANTLSVTTVVLASGRILTWGHVRPWTSPDGRAGSSLSQHPILLWVDGLDQP
jgi:alpha-tubulin suppressor-like RCC1 family protein